MTVTMLLVIPMQGEVGLSSAGMFLVVSSASLLLIFYFISAMTVLITIVFCLITTLSLSTLVYPYFDYWTGFKYNRDVEVPLLGPIPVLGELGVSRGVVAA
jgi:hypothetical protein